MTIYELIAKLNEHILNPIIVLLFAIALVVFVWGGLVFIARAEDEAARSTGKSQMFWGIIGMVIMASVFAILRILVNTFGIDDPNFPF